MQDTVCRIISINFSGHLKTIESTFLQLFWPSNFKVSCCSTIPFTFVYQLSHGDWMISHMNHNLLICIEDKMAFCPQQRSKGDPGRTAGLQTPLSHCSALKAI